MKYFHKNRIVEFGFALDARYDIGTTYEDNVNGKYVKLTKKQLTFKAANPNASVLEVFKAQLNTVTTEQQLLNAKYRKLSEIEQADKASELFYINSVEMWLDKNTRTSLVANTIPALEASGVTSTKLWAATDTPIAVVVDITTLKSALSAIEIYAKQTYDITQTHKSAVLALATVEEVEAYNANANYPAILNFNI